jgi:hypothetical protein
MPINFPWPSQLDTTAFKLSMTSHQTSSSESVEAEQLAEQLNVSFDMLTLDKNEADKKLQEEKYEGLSDGLCIGEKYIVSSSNLSQFVFYTHLCLEIEGDGRVICATVEESPCSYV